jgi:hypothetical protein
MEKIKCNNCEIKNEWFLRSVSEQEVGKISHTDKEGWEETEKELWKDRDRKALLLGNP